jgi:hypothetical protein
MLDTLRSLTKNSIRIFENSSAIDFDELSKKPIFLFVSSEVVATMTKKPEQVKSVFILDSDVTKIDQRERFATGEDLLCQLADEIYRCYIKEASEYLTLGDSSMAEIKTKHADRIHNELKKVHEKYFVSNNTSESSVCTVTTLVWLKLKSQDNIEVQKVEELFSKVVSSFLVFDNHLDCHKYLLENEPAIVTFLIIDNEYEDSIVTGFQQLSNVKVVYRYGQSSSKNEATIKNCHDLCFRLTYDLMNYYNKLGSDWGVKQDAKTAKDMFMKAHELCNIFDKI